MKLRVLDLFSGIGGISLGLERTGGFGTIAFCEVEPFPRLVLERRWPTVPIFDDVRELTGDRIIGGVDVIAGGFPCQPHSVAGKRKGQADERHLWPEFARLVRELRPRWVLAENVPGIRTTAADEVCGDLEAAGYTVWPLVVGADDVGAPHRRKRVWFVGRAAADSESSKRRTEHQTRTKTNRRPNADGQWKKSAVWAGGLRETYAAIRGVDDGLSSRLDRLRCLGNSVVPQIVEAVGRAILAVERS